MFILLCHRTKLRNMKTERIVLFPSNQVRRAYLSSKLAFETMAFAWIRTPIPYTGGKYAVILVSITHTEPKTKKKWRSLFG